MRRGLRIAWMAWIVLGPSTGIAAPAPALTPFQWLTGRWVGGHGTAEEIWSAPEGDAMMGMGRHGSNEATKLYEFATITAEERGGVVLRLRRFPKRAAVEGDVPELHTLNLVQQASRRAVFEGQEDGQTVRFTYSVTPSGGLSCMLEKPSGVEQHAFEKAGPTP